MEKAEIENLAEFMYLGYYQTFWEVNHSTILAFSQLDALNKTSWRAAATVAYMFFEKEKFKNGL